jgi:Leucine-rich repeat (LRR) protein
MNSTTQEIETINIIIVLPNNREEMITININDNIVQTITDYYDEFEYIDLYYEDIFIEYGLSPLDCCITTSSRITVDNVGRIKNKEQVIDFIKELYDINEIKFEEKCLYELFDNDFNYILFKSYDLVINRVFYTSTIKILPYSVGRLDIQDHLEFFKNNLESLPENFGRIKVGGNLYLCNNKLTSLPESFGRLKIRGTLNLCDNKLNELPESFVNLKIEGHLDLSGNKLKSLPESFSKIEIGGNLDLSTNQLESLPESFLEIKLGGSLNLSNNQISSLPEIFSEFTLGGDLNLSYNKIKSLPESFSEIKLLGILNLSYNQLISLPKSFLGLNININDLGNLNLHENHLKSESMFIISALSEDEDEYEDYY